MTKKQKYHPSRSGYLRHEFKTRPHKPVRPILIGREWSTKAFNDQLGANHGHLGHEAVNQIRIALAILGTARISTMDLNHIPATGGDWSPKIIEMWGRFQKWHKDLGEANHSAREATIAFAKGHKLREIDSSLKVRNGSAKKLIQIGVAAYVEIMKGEKKRPPKRRKPHPKRKKAEFKASKIVEFLD